MTGPLAQQFAQAREAIEFGYGGDPNYKPFYYEGLTALSVIERHVQDMETALQQASECCARPPGVCFDPAALPASRTSGEKGTE